MQKSLGKKSTQFPDSLDTAFVKTSMVTWQVTVCLDASWWTRIFHWYQMLICISKCSFNRVISPDESPTSSSLNDLTSPSLAWWYSPIFRHDSFWSHISVRIEANHKIAYRQQEKFQDLLLPSSCLNMIWISSFRVNANSFLHHELLELTKKFGTRFRDLANIFLSKFKIKRL